MRISLNEPEHYPREKWDTKTVEILQTIYKHGSIKSAHKNGYGSVCYMYENIPDIPMVYYILACSKVKIGTVKNRDNFLSRMKTIKNTIPCESSLYNIHQGDKKTEEILHKIFSDYRSHGEWFDAIIIDKIEWQGDVS
jgi:hypothetical protein